MVVRSMALAAFVVALLDAETFRIVPGPDSFFAVEVAKTKLWAGRKHVFHFSRYRGEVQDSSAVFTVEAASLSCKDDWVKPGQIKDIEKAALDILEPSKYPEIRFVSTRVVPGGVEGSLTIHGVTRPVTVAVENYEGSASVSLAAFGLKPPSGAFRFAIGTADVMTVRFKLRAEPVRAGGRESK
jgi:polyisoprenoid-binding protein YceI